MPVGVPLNRLRLYVFCLDALYPPNRRRKLGRKPEDIVKLDANENPYGPPPEVLQALGSMKFPNIYPDPEQRALRKALAEREGVPMENILGACPEEAPAPACKRSSCLRCEPVRIARPACSWLRGGRAARPAHEVRPGAWGHDRRLPPHLHYVRL